MKIPQKPAWLMWDHNIHYHQFLLRHIPAGAQRALDVGCGAGLFAARLAEKIPDVIAIDRDAQAIDTARAASGNATVTFLEGDVMTAELSPESFDFISCLAALHHMPLHPALERFASLLSPGGVLVVLGLYRLTTPLDYGYAALTGLLDLGVGIIRHRTQAPIRRSGGVVVDWHNSLHEIKATTREILPGARVRRHIYDRYSLIYARPERGG